MFEVREVLRMSLRGEGFRGVERLAGVDRKTVRRYVTAAEGLGLVRCGGEGQLTDVFMGQVWRRCARTGPTVTGGVAVAGGEPRPDRGLVEG